MVGTSRWKRVAQIVLGVLVGATLAVAAFAFMGRGDADEPKAGQQATERADESVDRTVSAPRSGSGSSEQSSSATSNTTKSSTTSKSSGSQPASGSSSNTTTTSTGGGADSAEGSDDVIGEIADQLGSPIGQLDDALADAGVDVDDVANDVVELVGDGVPLEEAVDQVLDNVVLDEIAEQLDAPVDQVGSTLSESGVDLEQATQDVRDLVDQGVPLEEAVDQVLGAVPAPSLPVPLPSTPVGGLLGGL
jgi:ABC-type transporter Mla subunit MlaD